MPSKEEKQRRKSLRESVEQRERTQALASMPISVADLKALFDFVDNKLEEIGCNHTTRHTLAFLEQHRLGKDRIIAWLAEYGGFCDCEVIANVEEKWNEIIGGHHA
jgi:hypothetical protein